LFSRSSETHLVASATVTRQEVDDQRNKAAQGDIQCNVNLGELKLSDHLSAEDIEALAWFMFDGHSYAQIAAWHGVHRSNAKRRIERAIKTLAKNGITVKPIPRERVKVIPVSKLRMREGAGLDEL
jgi:DNA-directed RNA polymerase specialized sigma24 family protein